MLYFNVIGMLVCVAACLWPNCYVIFIYICRVPIDVYISGFLYPLSCNIRCAVSMFQDTPVG